MPVRFIHTADLQLGMPFLRVVGDAGARLRELRLAVIDRIADVAREHAADFIVMAGDVYDANTVDGKVVAQSCAAFRRAGIPILLIPGNHDHAGSPDSVFARRDFLAESPPNLFVLAKRDPHALLDGRALILPAPLLNRHEIGDTTSHWSAESGRDLAPHAVRIGLAHGSVYALGGDHDDPDHATNRIAPDRAERAALDYLALGDWHGLRQIDAKTWYAGTPEPTSYKQNEPGHVLVVEIDAPGSPPKITPVRVARSRWFEHVVAVHTLADIESLRAWFAVFERPEDLVLRLIVEGTLPLADLDRLEATLVSIRHATLQFDLRNAVMPAASDEELASIATDGYVKVAVDSLRARVAEGGETGQRAALALQILYSLHREGGDAC